MESAASVVGIWVLPMGKHLDKPVGKHPDKLEREMMSEALITAVADAGMTKNDSTPVRLFDFVLAKEARA